MLALAGRHRDVPAAEPDVEAAELPLPVEFALVIVLGAPISVA